MPSRNFGKLARTLVSRAADLNALKEREILSFPGIKPQSLRLGASSVVIIRGLRNRTLTFYYWTSSVYKQEVNKYVMLKRLLSL